MLLISPSSVHSTELLLQLPPGSPILLLSLPVASPHSTRGKSRVQAMFPDLPLPKVKLLHENIYFPSTCTHCKYVMKNITQRTLTSSFSQVPAPVWAGDALRTAVQGKNTPIWKLQIHMKRRDFNAGRQKL